jgi:uncharacterized protein YkwD
MRIFEKARYRIIAFAFVLILLFSLMPVQVDISYEVEASKYGDITPPLFEVQLLDKINENRSNNGAGPVVFNSSLVWVARAHSQDMIDHDFFDHNSSVEGPFNGAMFDERVNDYADYENTYCGECLAIKSWGIDVEDTMFDWKNSPGHWVIIIDPLFKEVGLGLLEGEYEGSPGVGLHTAVFGGGSISIDLTLSSGDISFDPASPTEGQVVDISATIYNTGATDAYPVIVKFYDGDPDSSGTQIGSEQQIPHILVHDESAVVSVAWDTTGESGSHDIYVAVDRGNIIPESNEGNNKAYKTVVVNAPIHLEPGWNLASFPHIVADTSLSNVFSSISGDYNKVQFYNASDSGDPWKHHRVGKPPSLNDLQNLNNKMGFWIYISDAGGADLAVAGSLPSSPQNVPLKKGWNLVGYPSSTQIVRADALNNLDFGSDIDAIEYYDTATDRIKTLGSGQDMEPGKGYWLHATHDCIWTVNS